MTHRLILAVAALLAAAAPAAAQEPAIAGRWIIAKAQIAPWADAKLWADRSEEKKLLGKAIVFSPKAVTAPAPIGCRNPVYSGRDDPPNMLFEGGLEGDNAAGKKMDPAALARALGMSTATVRTVEVGCSEFAFHRFAADTLVFALDNRIYTMHRDPKAKR